jgi:hypothetical protein
MAVGTQSFHQNFLRSEVAASLAFLSVFCDQTRETSLQ